MSPGQVLASETSSCSGIHHDLSCGTNHPWALFDDEGAPVVVSSTSDILCLRSWNHRGVCSNYQLCVSCGAVSWKTNKNNFSSQHYENDTTGDEHGFFKGIWIWSGPPVITFFIHGGTSDKGKSYCIFSTHLKFWDLSIFLLPVDAE